VNGYGDYGCRWETQHQLCSHSGSEMPATAIRRHRGQFELQMLFRQQR
jgi:hypothetical protein